MMTTRVARAAASSLLSAALFLSCAPSVQAKPPSRAEARAHEALRGLRDQLVAALNAGDLDGLLAPLHQDVMFTAMNGEVCRGKDQVRAYFERMLRGPRPVVASLRVEPQADDLTRLFGGDAGVATGSSRDSYRLANGLEFTVNSRWTATVVKERGRWVVAALHSSADVFDNPLLDKAKRLAFWGALLAAALGAALAWLLKDWARKRKK